MKTKAKKIAVFVALLLFWFFVYYFGFQLVGVTLHILGFRGEAVQFVFGIPERWILFFALLAFFTARRQVKRIFKPKDPATTAPSS